MTQECANLNYTNAEAFGEVVFLTAQEVSPVPGSLINADIMRTMGGKLQTFDFEHDYLCPSGSPVVCGLAFYTLREIVAREEYERRRPKTLRVLRWSNRDRVYQPITIPLEQ